MTDHNLREIASRCEAKLHGFRRTADGVVVSFVVSPIDVPPALALDPLGTRYQLAFVAIGDDEQPLPASRHEVGERPLSVTRPVQQGVIHRTDSVEESVFEGGAKTGPQRGCGASAARDRYAVMSSGEKAVTRAAMLPKDERFRAWVLTEAWATVEWPDRETVSEEEYAAEFIRLKCCGGASRKLIAEDPEAMDKFIALETAFRIAVGEIAEPR